MLFSYGSGHQWIDGNKKCRRNDGNFDCHGNAAVGHGAHRPMEHIWGFTWSHWMPPSAECLRRIAPAAAMVDKFEWNTQNTNKILLLASNYGTFQSLVVCENFNPKTDPLLSSSMRQALCKYETPHLELKSSRSFLAIKRCQRTKFGKVLKLVFISFSRNTKMCSGTTDCDRLSSTYSYIVGSTRMTRLIHVLCAFG